MEDFCKQYKFGKTLLSQDRLETISYLRNRLKTINDIEPGPVKTLWRIWTEFKINNNYKDFTDLISECLEMSIAPGSPLSIIADEAQDLTPLQIKLLRHWNKHLKELYLVGDDDQSIYGFIGADSTEMIRKDLIDTQINTNVLTVSRRLPEVIHKYSKDYIERNLKREEKAFTHNGQTGFIKNIGVPINHDKTLNLIISEAKDKTVMIIAACDYMLDDIISKMKKKGVPFGNKYKINDNRWNPIDIKIYNVINAIRESKTRGDIFLWIKYIKKEYIKNKIIKPTDLEKDTFYRIYLEDILTETEFDIFEELEVSDRINWFIKHIQDKYVKKFEYAEKVINGIYKDLKDICVGSIHSVKGREAQVVFICPDKSPAMEKGSVFDKSEIIRQFYVAMTRASEKLYFCIPNKLNHGIRFKV
jgi:DNA helicase-2/ATP-dependent DNA helicase PcrA